MPWHVLGGRALLYMGIVAALTGLAQRATMLGQSTNAESRLINFTGLAILLFGVSVDFSVALGRYNWWIPLLISLPFNKSFFIVSFNELLLVCAGVKMWLVWYLIGPWELITWYLILFTFCMFFVDNLILFIFDAYEKAIICIF